ncbi:MAG: mandelate racemase/muconate lactonizing enzyme family protein, partial [bacterium]|nr:mandelate racemase/muconate lactonizing enzyme family protein [bacterium]
AAADLGVACVEAIREAVGPDVDILIDCHSFFDVDLAIDVARRLRPQRLAWYEEPVAPTDVAATKAIASGIEQRMAGGEFLFGIEGFGALCREQAVDVIMPDVKHCGGLLEARKIAAVAELDGIAVSPHNPSGPVATAASAQLCAGLPNFEILEMQWGEAAWRGDLVLPPERFENGSIAVPDGPGLGVELNDAVAREHA